MDEDSVSWIETARAAIKFISSPFGVPALAPCIITMVDAYIQVLPISSLVKPSIYILLLLSCFFALFLPVVRQLSNVSAAPTSSLRCPLVMFIVGMLSLLAYPACLAFIDENIPQSRAALMLAVWLSSAVLLLGIALVTASFSTLAVKAYKSATA